jgi:hypothetical protein
MTADGHEMGTDHPTTIGMFLVRAWLHDQSLVARVIRTPDLASVPAVTVVVASRHRLHNELASWLQELGVSASPDSKSEDD